MANPVANPEEPPDTKNLSGFYSKKNQDEFKQLEVTSTLVKPMTLSFDYESSRRGDKDLAELRTDRTGTYYSNFTPQGHHPEICLPKALHSTGTIMLFIKCAFENLVFTPEALGMSLLGCGAVFVFSENVLDMRYSMEKSAVFVGLIFPLVFLIGQTWGRREQASVSFSAIRGNGVHMVLKLLSAGKHEAAHAANQRMRELCDEIAMYLPQDSYGSLLRIANIYGIFGALDTSGEPTLVRFMVVEFEKLRQLRNYRTPWTLNYFVFFFGNLAPVVFAPMFSTVGCLDKSPERATPEDGAGCGYGTFGAYASMTFFTLLLAALLGVVKALEDPFSLDGFDDLVCQFNIESRALEKVIDDRMALAASGIEPPRRNDTSHMDMHGHGAGGGGMDGDDDVAAMADTMGI